jgi:hypothetical protein
MVLYLNDKEICTSQATYEGHNIAAMNTCDKAIKVKKGDALVLKSVYDITKHPMFVLHLRTMTLRTLTLN